MDDVALVIIGFAVAVFVAVFFVIPKKEQAIMEEAYTRGYAVECRGVEGYHWECGNE